MANRTNNKNHSMSAAKNLIKRVLGDIPLTAEIYWLIKHRSGTIASRFSLSFLDQNLSGMCAEVSKARISSPSGNKVFLFSSSHIWLNHAALLGLGLAARGHSITLGYLPYSDWFTNINRFDLRRQNLYAQRILKRAIPLLKPVSFLNIHAGYKSLPDELEARIEEVSRYDAQYTDQVEEVDLQSEVYQLRCKRNMFAARTALSWLQGNRPDVVIVPNGSILEFGVIYEVARFMNLPVVTYEFGDQRERIWLAQNAKVMLQETDSLWSAYKDQPLRAEELEKVKSLFEARRKASVWGNFSRLWQGAPAEGVALARKKLDLNERPVVLLATNVLGDSLTLGRQIFSATMQEWIERTLQYFAGRNDVQLIIRIHPGEVLTHGTSMVDVVNHVLPHLPEHIHLIRPEEKVNTYDLIAAADVGLVYTTTVGLEMAMSGIPVLVSGNTHYRGRGFTHDPQSWLRYFKILGPILNYPEQYRLSENQIDLAWRYAYRFFFDFPRPFPWHLHFLKQDYLAHPIQKLAKMSWGKYDATFDMLVGEPLNWQKIHDEQYSNG